MLLVTLFVLVSVPFLLFIGIKEEILSLIVLCGALLSIYAALIVKRNLQGRKKSRGEMMFQ